MIDITNSHIDLSRADLPVENSTQLNEILKSGDSTQRNFYQKSRRDKKRKASIDIGPAVILCLSNQARHVEQSRRIVLRYNRFCQLEYMDA